MTSSDVGSGKPVVFVHGFPFDQTLWQAQTVLSSRFRLLRFNLPGFGGAAPLQGAPTMEGYASSVIAQMDAARLERAILCGLSMGGYVLLEIWRRYPKRVGGLVLCDTRPEPDTPEGQAARQEAISRIRAGERDQVIEELIPRLLSPSSARRFDHTEYVRSMARQASDEGLIAALQAMHDRPDSVPTLATIDVPTLVVVGAQDSLTPPAVAIAMHQRIAGSQYAEIPGSGHVPPIENPAVFNAALLATLI